MHGLICDVLLCSSEMKYEIYFKNSRFFFLNCIFFHPNIYCPIFITKCLHVPKIILVLLLTKKYMKIIIIKYAKIKNIMIKICEKTTECAK